ncbi:alpha/beta fold hydrolase [Microcoleus sp. FACHB-1515]|nr:alpha/beta fold hydrolase [Microcoleus sp. FACHB-1515]
MSDDAAIAAVVEATRKQEAARPLMDGAASIFHCFDRPTPKAIVFFHGFTAIPAQFDAIATVFHAAGYNVIVPLLPGHGIADDWSRDHPPPLPEDWQVYETFGCFWLQQAAAFGDRVIVGGLSGGANLAGWLAVHHADRVDRALLFAPYLSNANLAVGLVVRTLDIYFEWKTSSRLKQFGYPGFSMPALRLLVEQGQALLDEAEAIPAAPMLIVSSDRDLAVNEKDHEVLFESVLRYQPKAWHFCFDAKFDVPHNMMTEAEGNDCADLVFAIAKAFVQSDLDWAEVLALRDGVDRGERFDQAVAALELGDRTSPDVLTIVTLMTNAE